MSDDQILADFPDLRRTQAIDLRGREPASTRHRTRTLVQLAGLMDSVIVTTATDFDDLAMLEPDGGRVLRLDIEPRTSGDVEALLRAVARDLPEQFLAARHVTVSGPARKSDISDGR